MTKTKRPNLHDVARLAGVSHTTVSRVLNNEQYVKEETASRVRLAMSDLGYRPNLSARSLVTNKSTILGVLIIPDSNLVGSLRILTAINLEASKVGFQTSITSSENTSVEGLRNAMHRLLDQNPAGVVIISSRKDGLDELVLVAQNFPLVFCKAGPDSFEYRVKLENEAAAISATNHLISWGHREIVHLSGPLGLIDSDERRLGFEKAMHESGLGSEMIYEGDWSADSGYNLGQKLIKSKRNFTAVFAGNDKMALGLIHALKANNMRVPNDVSLVGFDDLEESKHFRPALTTVRQDFEEFGSRSVAMIQSQISGETAPILNPILPELVSRNSCAQPSKQNAD